MFWEWLDFKVIWLGIVGAVVSAIHVMFALHHRCFLVLACLNEYMHALARHHNALSRPTARLTDKHSRQCQI